MVDRRWPPFGNHELITTSYDVVGIPTPNIRPILSSQLSNSCGHFLLSQIMSVKRPYEHQLGAKRKHGAKFIVQGYRQVSATTQ